MVLGCGSRRTCIEFYPPCHRNIRSIRTMLPSATLGPRRWTGPHVKLAKTTRISEAASWCGVARQTVRRALLPLT